MTRETASWHAAGGDHGICAKRYFKGTKDRCAIGMYKSWMIEVCVAIEMMPAVRAETLTAGDLRVHDVSDRRCCGEVPMSDAYIGGLRYRFVCSACKRVG
jgi:hypothetical protein